MRLRVKRPGGEALGLKGSLGVPWVTTMVALQESTAILEVERKVMPASAVGGVGLASDILGLVTRAVRCGD